MPHTCIYIHEHTHLLHTVHRWIAAPSPHPTSYTRSYRHEGLCLYEPHREHTVDRPVAHTRYSAPLKDVYLPLNEIYTTLYLSVEVDTYLCMCIYWLDTSVREDTYP